MKPWWETHPRKYWTAHDWRAARKAGVVPPERDVLDPAERLLAEGVPKAVAVSLYDDAKGDRERTRREVDRLLEKHGLASPRRPW